MSQLCRTLRVNGLLFFASTVVLIVFLACFNGVMQAQEDALDENDAAKLSVAYARACLKLAEVELAEAGEQNSRSKNSVSNFDVERLQLHVRFAQQNLSYAEQGADYSQSIIGHIEMQSRLAELDLKTAGELRQKHLSPITDCSLRDCVVTRKSVDCGWS